MSTRNIIFTPSKIGDHVTAKLFNDIKKAIASQQLVAGKNVKLRQSNSGTIIDVEVNNNAYQQKDLCVIGKIRGKATQYSTEGCYEVDVYDNGIGREPTRKAIAFCIESASNSDVPAGTWVLLHGEEFAVTSVGGLD